jgi:hypothetical protein
MSLPDGSVVSGESTTTEDISLSVQATNALREKLGLKPLRDGPSAQEQQIVEQRKVKEAVRHGSAPQRSPWHDPPAWDIYTHATPA